MNGLTSQYIRCNISFLTFDSGFFSNCAIQTVRLTGLYIPNYGYHKSLARAVKKINDLQVTGDG